MQPFKKIIPNRVRVSSVFLFLMLACRTTKTFLPTLTELQTKETTRVSLKQLLNNKRMYHGLAIETEGKFVYGGHDFSIHYIDTISVRDTVIFVGENFWGLGLNLHPTYYIDNVSLRSYRDKFIRVKGVFDSSYIETIGGLPEPAQLRNVFLIEPVE